MSAVAGAEPRRLRRLTAVTLAIAGLIVLPGFTVTPSPSPSDPDPLRAAEYWLDDYGIRDAWKTSTGSGVRIAVIDTGIGKGPVEFSGVVGGTDVSGLGSPDGRTPVGARDPDHGSWVASLAASRGTSPVTGMLGVAPDAQLLSISVGFGVSASVPFAEQIAQAIYWAVDNGADIINLSFTTNTPDWDRSWDDAFMYAFEHDVVVVAAAGNRGSGTGVVGAPATIPGVLVVGGVDPHGRASREASTQGITIAVAAPSENLLGVSADGKVVEWDGTSGAAPIVAGIAALVRSAYPDMDADDVINRIIRTATPPAGVTDLPDPLYGYGLVDAEAAVTASVPAVRENPLGSLAEWITIYRRANLVPDPEPTVPPAAVEPLPPVEQQAAASPLLPSTESLLYGTVPLAAGTVAAILVALGVTAAVRRVRLAPRAPRR
ncbi:S8 family serine peptidase [Microbacterium sp. 67-17]|uniref:S8 family serine peptidase n=1 Tax=Microbacterium sp. 67-17 TaxID=1895782 RepID=UPI000A8A8BBA|nr:S8 family serine peptidase [Microbacterium sp. 67-17]